MRAMRPVTDMSETLGLLAQHATRWDVSWSDNGTMTMMDRGGRMESCGDATKWFVTASFQKEV